MSSSLYETFPSLCKGLRESIEPVTEGDGLLYGFAVVLPRPSYHDMETGILSDLMM